MKERRAVDVVDIHQIEKTYPGMEPSLRGTKLAAKGPALWVRNLVRAAHLTASPASPVRALVDVTLRIAQGDIFGLVGRNGSGKTTLIKILAGLIRPTAGVGQVVGVELTHPQEIRKNVSYVSTTGWMGLEWPLTAEENVRFFATLCGMPGHQARARAEQALRDVDMWADRRKYPSQLSNGMRQRVILARALLFYTPLVLLDEPTVGLDPLSAQAALDLIRGRLRERGQTVLLTDHQSTEMAAVADRIAVLQEGRIAMLGTPAELIARLRHLTVIEVHTEEMDRPPGQPPPEVQWFQVVDRPGPLGVRTWRIHALKGEDALPSVLDWLAQPSGRIVFLAESAPSLHDVLALPAGITAAEQAGQSSGVRV